ncbi:predicted protein [Histoplasma capsulatum G186AR]|uniref:Uncharacterized protein n=2 Tax=Ajellomyces capsulatus TaxID=5037 RepID=C0NRA3_AJECG|nr:uncharacterized protein HCBG_05533 [Histoplasma capsulatum G186AR]EEH06217.1 predicted protein [Histoplasma capsulatum G186AR]KAG5293321.1 hypothetical protein I7I52_04599 [Histoplasma capsulatum]QSS74772.1 hypothetical protein I7I50_03692 [Histoplasma capsulatum G186AR]
MADLGSILHHRILLSPGAIAAIVILERDNTVFTTTSPKGDKSQPLQYQAAKQS